MSGKCCKGYTYRCDKCNRKFCISCQSSHDLDGNEYCYNCYYMIRGQREEHDEEEVNDLKERIEELEGRIGYWIGAHDDARDGMRNEVIELIKKQPQQIDRDRLVELVEKELGRGW